MQHSVLLCLQYLIIVLTLVANDALAYVIPSKTGVKHSPLLERDDITSNTTLMYYRLYTRKNPDDWQVLQLGNVKVLNESNFNSGWPVKIYAGGWPAGDGANIKEQYFYRGDYNFIVPDYQVLAPSEEYVLSAVRIAGKHTAAFIDFLIETTGISLSSFHVNGHSAGAHVAGATGLGYKELHNGTVLLPRVTGLDPANFIQDFNDTNSYIDDSDASFVDIIHTDDYAGIYRTLGHADFYVNGGHHQPDCPPNLGEGDGCCSHCRALYLYDESINTWSGLGFNSLRCSSYEAYLNGSCAGNDVEIMGEYVSFNASGTYYLETNDAWPWAKG